MTQKSELDKTAVNAPLDIKPRWLNIARKLQQFAHTSGNQGVAIITMRIVIDADFEPRMYCEPTLTKIEPKRLSDDILTLLSGGELSEDDT